MNRIKSYGIKENNVSRAFPGSLSSKIFDKKYRHQGAAICKRLLFSAAVLVMTGTGGWAMQSASAQALDGQQVTRSALNDGYMYAPGRCEISANGTLGCSGQPAAAIAPAQDTSADPVGVGGSNPLVTSGIGIIPDSGYSQKKPSGDGFEYYDWLGKNS